jgi:hypothetical protein
MVANIDLYPHQIDAKRDKIISEIEDRLKTRKKMEMLFRIGVCVTGETEDAEMRAI